MEWKKIIYLCILVVSATAFRSRRRQRMPKLPQVMLIPNMAIPCPNVIETVRPPVNGPNLEKVPELKAFEINQLAYLPTKFDCMNNITPCKEPLVLPPKALELPIGLGYLSGAMTDVADAFEPAVNVNGCFGTYLPVSPSDSRLVLSAPLCPEYAALVRPIIL